jgi:hypothetical protein
VLLSDFKPLWAIRRSIRQQTSKLINKNRDGTRVFL